MFHKPLRSSHAHLLFAKQPLVFFCLRFYELFWFLGIRTLPFKTIGVREGILLGGRKTFALKIDNLP